MLVYRYPFFNSWVSSAKTRCPKSQFLDLNNSINGANTSWNHSWKITPLILGIWLVWKFIHFNVFKRWWFLRLGLYKWVTRTRLVWPNTLNLDSSVYKTRFHSTNVYFLYISAHCRWFFNYTAALKIDNN